MHLKSLTFLSLLLRSDGEFASECSLFTLACGHDSAIEVDASLDARARGVVQIPLDGSALSVVAGVVVIRCPHFFAREVEDFDTHNG